MKLERSISNFRPSLEYKFLFKSPTNKTKTYTIINYKIKVENFEPHLHNAFTSKRKRQNHDIPRQTRQHLWKRQHGTSMPHGKPITIEYI
jgi:hypothetical protein